MTDTLQGKTALVTGASRGIGRAIAEKFAASGALVAVHFATNRTAADAALSAITNAGGQGFLLQAQFGTPGAVQKLVSELDAELRKRGTDGGIDVLVNNAGGGGYSKVADTTEEYYDRTFDLNARTPFFLTQALLPKLRAGGSIVNISSEATRINLVETVAYGMAKSALEHFTRCLAKEIGPRDIRVNSVSPGIIRTDQNDDFMSIPERHAEVLQATALRREGHVSDMAAMVHALATTPGGFVTGQLIEVSGGYLL
jgi:3-oxoacyl-[acyl-carrier protein] reductase